ncbi:alpha-S1-casein isoform X5 [Aotus nancymaae]|uniref:alpha-S1-casein isoform X5 n=1 Tax=Aotus nancymaae TaxID=37293 RepID=UPI0030FE0B4F
MSHIYGMGEEYYLCSDTDSGIQKGEEIYLAFTVFQEHRAWIKFTLSEMLQNCEYTEMRNQMLIICSPGTSRCPPQTAEKYRSTMRREVMALTTMKLLILTCLVAVALARPKPSENSEEIIKERKFLRLDLPTPLELREEYINGMNRQRKVLREKQSDEIKNRVMAEPEQSESSTSSSSEEISLSKPEKQFHRLNKYNQLQLQALQAQKYIPRERVFYQPCLEQTCRMSENNVQVQLESSTSSSSEQALQAQKYIPRERVFYQPYLEQTHRMSENNHVQVPFQQLSQLAAYPYAVWYYPQIRQNLPFPPFSDISSPVVPENYEKTDVMLQW